MKTKISILAALVLSACGTVTQVPPQFYRAQGQADQLAISGTLSQSKGVFTDTNDITVSINGETVIKGTIEKGSKEFPGMYAGKPVSADCSVVSAGSVASYLLNGSDRTDVKCTVYVAGERAANLVMVP